MRRRDRGRQGDGERELKEESYQGSSIGSAEWEKKGGKDGEMVVGKRKKTLMDHLKEEKRNKCRRK